MSVPNSKHNIDERMRIHCKVCLLQRDWRQFQLEDEIAVCTFCRHNSPDFAKYLKPKKKPMPCLMCGEKFLTTIGNRVCGHCKDSEAWKSGPDE